MAADPERNAGWFWCRLNGGSYDSDQLDDAYLAPAEGAAQQKYQLIEAAQENDVLRVRAAEHAPRDGLFLWIPKGEPGRLEKSLLDGLSSIERFDLSSQFDSGLTTPLPGTGTAESAPERARAACGTPGVHLVWGPPGTGKTRVISLALQDLIGLGKSALLVSGTNIAVDNALERACRSGPARGTMIRVGTPHLTAIAENPDVCLDTLVRAQQAELERKRLLAEERIRALRQDSRSRELTDTLAELEGFDADEFKAAQDRLALAENIKSVLAELCDLRNDAPALRATAAADTETRDRLRSQRASATTARRFIDEAKAEQAQAATYEKLIRKAEASVAELELKRSEFSDPERSLQLFGSKRGARRARKDNDRELKQKTAYRDSTRSRYERFIAGSRKAAAEHLRNAFPHTPETIDRLDEYAAAAEARAGKSVQAVAKHAQRIKELDAWLRQVAQYPQATEGDRVLVKTATALDLAGKHARLPQLRHRAEENEQAIAAIEEEHEKLITAMRRGKSEISRGIIREAKVVATTLAMARMSREVRERDYDFVIVDEVAASCPPEVLYAASRAREGVTLLGDFMQNAPIIPDKFKPEKSKDRVVQHWYQQDCYALFGIGDARSAANNQGCVTLTKQYRFGKVINDLANLVAYDGMLKVGDRDQEADGGQDQEVVLIDVDGLGEELAGVRKNPAGSGSWWPVGALLSGAIAKRHAPRSQSTGPLGRLTVGILTPFKIQQELTKDFLAESGASPMIEVGTSHRFQGREFDTVVFDMVEDGKQWIAQGNRDGNSYARGGLRLFTVGITRAKKRLYLIANGTAIDRAEAGPLRAIGDMKRAGTIRTVLAREVLGLPEEPVGDPAARDLWEALRDHPTKIDIYDEERLPAALISRIDQAKESIWIWSPWAGKQSREYLPHLQAAAGRGVDVYPVLLPPDDRDVGKRMKPVHEEVARMFPRSIYMIKEHQKLIVIDRTLTFIGSMNVLSHRPGTTGRREIMVLFQGSPFAQDILDHEQADLLAFPPRCAQCNRPVERARLRRYGRGDNRMEWFCDRTTSGRKCNWTLQFPDREGARNQSRPRR
ncbi:MAG: AAA domain-containing protein [Trebonia sp.]